MPLISIVIPTYNSSATLDGAIHSVLQQTFEDYEILIIDGLSTDNTVEIAESFNDQRIKVISEKDAGIYDAMNKGIALCSGEWMLFLGSDDILYNEHVLDKVAFHFGQGAYDVVYGNVVSSRFNDIYDGEFTVEKLYKKNICHQAIFFNKSVFAKVGNFNLMFKAHADWDHNMRWFCSKAINRNYIDEIIANYSDGGFSSVTGDRTFNDYKTIKYLTYAKHMLPFELKMSLFNAEFMRFARIKDTTMLSKLLGNIFKFI